MALTLTTETNPGNASWTASSHLVAAAGVVTFGNGQSSSLGITVPAGLESAPILLSYQNDPNNYNIAGGRTYASITGTTLTIQLSQSTDGAGLKISYAVLAAI